LAETQWLRLKTALDCPLRRGAWYQVDSITRLNAVVTVDGKPVTLPLGSVEIRTTQPRAWSIVRPADSSPRGPEFLQSGYIVCPSCRSRAVLPFARVLKTRCPACKELFEIAWDEKYFEAS
jgi:hypothetical protein